MIFKRVYILSRFSFVIKFIPNLRTVILDAPQRSQRAEKVYRTCLPVCDGHVTHAML